MLNPHNAPVNSLYGYSTVPGRYWANTGNTVLEVYWQYCTGLVLAEYWLSTGKYHCQNSRYNASTTRYRHVYWVVSDPKVQCAFDRENTVCLLYLSDM